MRFLPDTNIFIALTRYGNVHVARRFETHRMAIGLSTVVSLELAFGAFSSNRPNFHLDTMSQLPFHRLDFTEDDARAAGEIRSTLKRTGTPIGPYDVLIAGQALVRGLILVTNNMREFTRVDGLKIEDWTTA